MKNPKKLRLQIARPADGKGNEPPNTPNLLKVTPVQRNENSSMDPSEKTKIDEPEKSDPLKPQPLSHLQLFRYANKLEVGLMVFGGICALGSACLVPANIFIFAEMVNAIADDVMENAIADANNTTAPSTTAILDAVQYFAAGNAVIGLIMFTLVYTSVMLFNYTSQRQAFRIRQLYLRSVLHQDISWYDHKMKSGNVATELTEDVIKLEEGIGEKVPIFIDHLGIFVFGIGVAFYIGWKLTLICLATLPVTSVILGIVARVSSALSRKELDAFGAASSVAEESLSAIKTVVAFNGQDSELKRYRNNLISSYKINVKLGLTSGCGFGFLWLGIYANYALSLWYGITLILEERRLPIEDQTYNATTMITVFFCTMVGAMNIGISAPYIESFSVAKAAAANIFSVIERKPTINSLDPSGIKLAGFQNFIDFKDVEFQYPSRPDVEVLKKVNFRIKKGETVALVGSSGCGKSTCIQLLQRFYDPIKGQVLIDGQDVRDLNVASLRSNIGIVSQEPVLFDMSIAENIRYGNLDATMEMVVEAAKQSNAHDFIMKLPSKYDTLVGERGAQISGGQKQRIAIARALIGNPEILLLDEATSALDTRSESKVQAALDKNCIGRTTIIVAHRLTTIRGASKIIVLSDGHVVEEGKHDELMELNGFYHKLVTAQVSGLPEPQHGKSSTTAPTEDIDEDVEPISMKSKVADEVTDGDKEIKKVGTWKVLKLNKPEWKVLFTAGIVSVVVGSSMPLFAVLFGDIIRILAIPDDDVVREESVIHAIYFISAGVVIGLSTFVQIFLLSIASESLTTRLRGLAFQAILKQEMAWFDEPSNGVGALCAKLSTEAAAVKGATGQRIGTIIQSISTIVIAIGLSIYYEWRLGLLGMAFIPLILFVTLIHGSVYKKETLNYHNSLERSTKIAVEAVSNIRTVAGIGREETFYKDYVSAVTPAFEQAKKNTHFRGLVYGLFKSVVYFAYAAVIYYGGVLAQNGDVEFSKVFKVAQSLIAGTLVVGQAAAFSPNLQKGVLAAAKIIALLERVPKIQDPKEPETPETNDGAELNFNKVSFAYSTRPDVTVLDSLNLPIESGKTTALIGSSGCGKSTVIKLIERFYDPVSGTIDLNRLNIKSITQSSLRETIGLVEQEPTVFARTIRENIAYGDNTQNVPMEVVIAAAKKANIHNFVTSLPLGYETKLGNKGTMLSGGQKQRVAIARALVNSPKILLLDEATSALDTESEKIVQAALNEAKAGRTCVLIAHRLSTVEDADCICILRNGSVVESGNHGELIRKKGLYYEMLSLNSTK